MPARLGWNEVLGITATKERKMAWMGEVEDGSGWGGLVPSKAEREQERREAAERQANTYARTLAIALHKKHYPDVVWHPLPDTLGLLTQIDNMVAGLVKPAAQGCDA